MFSCDYNGWADVPEEEREGIEAFEAAFQTPPELVVSFTTRQPPPSFHAALALRAA